MRKTFQRFRNILFRLKRWLIFAVINILKRLSRGPFNFIPSILVRGIQFLPIHPDRLEALYTHVFELKDSEGSISAAQVLVNLETWQKGFKTQDLSLGLQSLAQNDVVNVFLEPGAPLPHFLKKSDGVESRYKIYSFADQSELVASLGINGRTTLIPLRDKFSDTDKDGAELVSFCKKSAEYYIKKISSGRLKVLSVDSENQFDSLATYLEDAFSHKLSLVMCLQKAIDDVPQNEAILYVAQSKSYLIDCWTMFKHLKDLPSIYVTFASPNQASHRGFWEALQSRLTLQKVLRSHIPTRLSVAVSSIEEKLNKRFENISNFVEKECQSLARIFTTDSEVFFLTLGKPGPYLDARDSLTKSLVLGENRNETITPVFLDLSSRKKRGKTASKINFMKAVLEYDLSHYTNLITKFSLSDIDLDTYIRAAELDLPSEGQYSGSELYPFLETIIKNFLQVQVSWWTINYLLGRQLGHLRPGSKFIGLSTRHPAVRSFTAGLQDENPNAGYVFDVQCLNVLPHPKYRRPIADWCTVIDHQAKALYLDYFNVSEMSIFIGGAPQYDSFISEYNALNKDDMLEKFSLDRDASILLFISQLQSMNLMFEILEAMCSVAQRNPHVHILIRLHPREGEGRKSAYREYLSSKLPSAAFSFSKKESVAQVLKVSSACVTWYSNMAREATLVGKDVIIPEFLSAPAPLKLSQNNLGVAAETNDALIKSLSIIAANEKRGKRGTSQYSIDNPALHDGNCTEEILKFILKKDLGLTNPIKKPTQPAGQVAEAFAKLNAVNVLVLAPKAHGASLQPYCMQKDIKVFGSSNISPYLKHARSVEDAKLDAMLDGKFNISTASKTANEVSDLCLKFLDDTKNSKSTFHKFFKRNRQAFWMSLRLEMMNIAKLELEISSAFNEQKPILIYGGTVSQIYWTLDQAKKNGIKEIDCFVLSDEAFGPPILLKAQEYKEENPRETIESPVQPLDTKALNRLISNLSLWLSEAQKINFNLPPKLDVLITTDWDLKTVPPTCMPIIEQLLGLDIEIMIANRRPKGMNALAASLNSAEHKMETIKTLDAETLYQQYNLPLTTTRSKMISLWRAWLKTQEFYGHQSPFIQNALQKSVKNLINVYLARIAIWSCFSDAVYASGTKLSLACPGRQWHTWVAHRSAEANRSHSMTLQNAYMSRGYTYFPPTAKYISCIDYWSKTLLADHYNVPISNLHVTSTPRFDALSLIDEASQPLFTLEKPAKHTLLFATQPEFLRQTLLIIRAISDIFDDHPNGDIHFVIKLHPRTTSEECLQIDDLVQTLNSQFITVCRDGDISNFIRNCDVVITMFSNVGIEAAIAKKPLIIAKAGMLDLPLPLDEFGIGCVAETYRDITIAVNKFLDDSAFRRFHQVEQKKFAEKNPIMIAGKSTATLTEGIVKRVR